MILWIEPIPKTCDFCGRYIDKVFVDANTFAGWCIVCANCFQARNMNLGLGIGQQYEEQDGIWLKTKG